MFSVGVLYLLFERSIISRSKSAKGQSDITFVNSIPRQVLGAQVGPTQLLPY